ncbi:MAG TPA: divergent PAP2 family protein [bacterium]|nr:divergent PAP2 family protein [bacterium]
MDFFVDHILLVPIVAWTLAILCKGIFGYIHGHFSMGQALGSGGMPSVHAALVTSLTTALGIKHGVSSELFAIGLVFSTIIIYDAINVRFEAGLHAKALNRISKKEGDPEIVRGILNESIGHLPGEALVGSLLGIAVAILCMSLAYV